MPTQDHNGEVFSVGVEVGDGVFRADEDHDGLAALFGWADVDNLDARGCGGERFVVADYVGVVGEALGFADVVAEDVFWLGDGGGFGEMVYERA